MPKYKTRVIHRFDGFRIQQFKEWKRLFMKKPMKLLRNLLVGVFAMSLWVGVNSQTVRADEEASIMPIDITIDYAKQKLILSERSTRDSEIRYEFGVRKYVKKYDTEICKFYTSSTLDYKDGLTIDLSSLKREKDNYIRLSGNYNESPITIKIPAINTKVKAKFDPVTAGVRMYDNTDKMDASQYTTEKIEYRSGCSKWEEYEYFDDFDVYSNLSKYQQRGAVLYFRLKAEDAQLLYTTAQKPSFGDIEDENGDDIPVYEALSFPGKEMKVVIPRLPKAPKVKVNYDKQIFTLPKGTEYRVVNTRSDMKWIPAKKSTSLQVDLSDLAAKYGADGNIIFEARLSQTETKPASRLYRVCASIPDQPKVSAIKSSVIIDGKQNIDQSCIKDEFGADALVAQYVFNEKRQQCEAVNFWTNLDEAYEICTVKGSGEPSPSNAGILKLKPFGDTKFAVSKLRDGSRLFIRRRADAKVKQFSGPWAVFGVVSYPEEEPDY